MFFLKKNQCKLPVLLNGEEFYIDGQPFRDSAIIPEQLIPFPYENTERGDPQFDAAINALLGII